MKIIHKIAAVVIQDNKFLLVRKNNSTLWTSLGGHPEEGETEEQALLREIKEEMGCGATLEKKLGDFEAKAGEDNAIVRLSTYLVTLEGLIVFEDTELAEYRFFGKDFDKQGIKIPDSIKNGVLPYCIENGLLDW